MSTEEAQWVEKARTGDKKALEALLRENYKILMGYLVKVTMNPTVAEDIAQETMVRAIMHIKSYQHMGKFSSWLIFIANNLYRDHLRKEKRLRPMEAEEAHMCEGSVESLAMDRLDMGQLRGVLAALPYEKRAVVILKHYYGYKYEEIAQILKCPVGTVRSRLHNSIRYIKEQMEGGKSHE